MSQFAWLKSKGETSHRHLSAALWADTECPGNSTGSCSQPWLCPQEGEGPNWHNLKCANQDHLCSDAQHQLLLENETDTTLGDEDLH